MLKIAYSPIYKYKVREGHRFPMEKYELIPLQLLHEGLVKEENFFTPQKLSEEDILLTHTQEYWHKLKTQTLTRKEIRPIGFEMSDLLVERGRHIAYGTYECCLFAMKYGVSLNVAGGTHHAFADHGEGFCVFNDFAIASNLLLKHQLVKQILIVDLDVHQGNGTAHIFQNRPEVFTFSMHGKNNYPLRKQQSDLDIALEDNSNDETYLSLLKFHLPRLIKKTKPDIILYLSGVDILENDKLGRLKVSKQGIQLRDQFVFQTAKKEKIPIAVSMGGGYAEKLADVVDCHTNTFKEVLFTYFD